MVEFSAASPALTADAEFAVSVALPAQAHPNPAQVIRNHRALLEMTAELFPGGVIEVTEEVDYEIPGDPYLVINVATRGEIPVMVAKNSQWHLRLLEVAPETASLYRLSLDLR